MEVIDGPSPVPHHSKRASNALWRVGASSSSLLATQTRHQTTQYQYTSTTLIPNVRQKDGTHAHSSP